MNFSWNESSQKSVISGIKIAPEHSLRDRQLLYFFFKGDVDFGTAPDRTYLIRNGSMIVPVLFFWQTKRDSSGMWSGRMGE